MILKRKKIRMGMRVVKVARAVAVVAIQVIMGMRMKKKTNKRKMMRTKIFMTYSKTY